MRIAIDAREILDRPTGVGRYLLQLLRAWSQTGETASHQFVLCATKPFDFVSSAFTTLTAPGSGTLWEQHTLPQLVRRARADVLFAPAYTSPIRCPVPVVVTIHDVSFAAHPEWFSWREGLRRRTLARWSAKRAARVIADSEFSKREIATRLGVDQSRIEVIYLGAPATPPPAAREPLVLYVGSIFNRRHLPALIGGFARLASTHSTVRLEIVGDNRTHPSIDIDAAIASSGAADRIRIRPYVSDAELSSLYSRASAFAFLSEYEGFGLTPLDALAAGVPIVVLDTEVAREIYGPAAVYVATPEPALVEAALEAALFDPATRRRVLDAAPQVLERYSWQESAHRTLQVLLAAAGH